MEIGGMGLAGSVGIDRLWEEQLLQYRWRR